jgi:hypothetical protein
MKRIGIGKLVPIRVFKGCSDSGFPCSGSRFARLGCGVSGRGVFEPGASGRGTLEIFFPFVTDFAEAGPIVLFHAVQGEQYLGVEFALQLLRERLIDAGEFGPDHAGLLQGAAVSDDGGERKIQAIEGVINPGLLGNIKGSQVCLLLR